MKEDQAYINDDAIIENIGGITSVWLTDDIYTERLYKHIGRYDYVATYTFKQDSASRTKFGEMITGTLVYTPKERESLEQSYLSGNKTYSKVRINETNFELSPDKQKSLKEEGFEITDIESVCALPMPRENLYINNSKRKPSRLEIPLPEGISYEDALLMIQHIYEKNVNKGWNLCPHEWNEYLAVKLLYCPDHLSESERQKAYETNEHIKEDVFRTLLTIKEEILKQLSEEESKALAVLQDREGGRKLTILNDVLISDGSSINLMLKRQPKQLAILLSAVATFRPFRLNTLAHKYPIYLDLERYLHILTRHVQETSVDLQPIAQKTKLLWDFKEFKYAIQGVVGVIADEYDQRRERETGRIYWNREHSIEFCGDYYTLQIDPNGRVEQWHREKNNVID